MIARDRVFARAATAAALVVLAPTLVPAGDQSFSTIVKHIESRYNAKRKGIPMLGLARLLVKLIKPAGVKNFKLVAFERLDLSADPGAQEFQSLVRTAVAPEWQPIAQFASRRRAHWASVYAQHLPEEVKMLVVTLQRQEAYVMQFKFSPDRLARFLEDPRILGIPLKNNAKSHDPPADPMRAGPN